MAEFLTTTGISHSLERIIRNANERLYLVSPYLQINPRLREFIEDKIRSKIDIRVIYREINPKQIEEHKWLESTPTIRRSLRKNLHAKCYLNEKEALLTSMNLYQFAQERNDEMGTLVSVDHDRELYTGILDDVMRIIRGSVEISKPFPSVEAAENSGASSATEGTASKPPQSVKPDPSKEAPATLSALENGFCIRCKAELAANPSKPYCSRCSVSWNQFKNPKYKEKYCHTCGNEHPTSMSRPLCRGCYRKYKDVLQLAAG